MSPTPMRHPETGLRDYRPELQEEIPRWLPAIFLGIVCLVAFCLGYSVRVIWP